MDIKYMRSLLFVSDVNASRHFYESVLGQGVWLDHGECVDFYAGFSIMLRDYANQVIFKAHAGSSLSGKGNANVELYFETGDITGIRDSLSKEKVRFVHDIFEHPWGQRGFRIYDPDGYIVEIGEPMDAVIKRYIGQGMSIEDAAARTSMPIEIVRQTIK